MIPREILRKIRRIQIRTSHRVDEVLAGTWNSAFKGRGIEFEEVRPYQVGDDVRSIDWNVTARSDQPYVKLYREERELAVVLLVDVSASENLGSGTQTKRDMIAELGATLAMSAIKNNDRVGLTLFSDRIEKHVPPNKGARHVLRLIRELLYCEPISTGTDLKAALHHLDRTTKRRSVVFLISDFQDTDFESQLRIAKRTHDIIPVVVSDPREFEIPNVGLVRLRDFESGETIVFDTSSRQNRELYSRYQRECAAERDRLFRSMRLDPIQLQTDQDIVDPLHRYFHRRERKR